ncbi:MAG: hypothetical protein DME44_02425 [Verrucomicrobia bacterium]|nr:MAG: hypothetical protein DME44_02425 [Verrucomicrobiota bacterium]
MPPPVRKAANHSSSGVGIIRSFRSRPAFSFAHTANLQEPGSSVTTQALSEDRPLVRAVLRRPRTCFYQHRATALGGSVSPGNANANNVARFTCRQDSKWLCQFLLEG